MLVLRGDLVRETYYPAPINEIFCLLSYLIFGLNILFLRDLTFSHKPFLGDHSISTIDIVEKPTAEAIEDGKKYVLKRGISELVPELIHSNEAFRSYGTTKYLYIFK